LHGGDLIGEWVAALSGRVKLSTIASAIHPYPTLVEINKRVAGAVLSKKFSQPRSGRLSPSSLISKAEPANQARKQDGSRTAPPGFEK
ncbi:MAG: hypothetical protein OEL66_07240, partial [Desulfobulbaceae bacterium]|nr:hypothetical protein [Desulfobulbaceae bacterium]